MGYGTTPVEEKKELKDHSVNQSQDLAGVTTSSPRPAHESQYLAKVEREESYYVRCSDCEDCQEECFNPQQSARFAMRDGWAFYGSRLLCPACAKRYPAKVLNVSEH